MKKNWNLLLIIFFITVSCKQKITKQPERAIPEMDSSGNYGVERKFLKKYTDIIELTNGASKVLIAPRYQGRVMTSTCNDDSGFSFGWINHTLISSHKFSTHINAYGGEERFWMGPEGGQYGLFFKNGDSFVFKNWQTPPIMDTVSFDLINKQSNFARFIKSFYIQNYSGTLFHVMVNREIKMIDKNAAQNILGISLPDVKWVGYQSTNSIKNIGNEDWNLNKGVLSIWLLSMMKSSANNIVIIPFKKGGNKLINDSYFKKVPLERLKKKDSILLFTADGNYRSKLGIPPSIVKAVVGSYDALGKVLTIIKFNFKGGKDYVNSMWQQQQFPFKGDVINAYNDGPNETGSQLGAFYELETSSPAIALKKNQTLAHTQSIFHFQGDKMLLNAIAKRLLGQELNSL